MLSIVDNFKEKILSLFNRNKAKLSYSQNGEDLIVDFIFKQLKIESPSYIDIGAFHPTDISNTYLFYQRGCSGMCVEPYSVFYNKIKNKRRRDICLNIGIGVSNESNKDFYIMSSKSLNTFSKNEAERCTSYGNQKIEKVDKVPLANINDLINDHFNECPNFISLDVEGLELEILKTFDFIKYRPEVFCIETINYTENNSEQKLNETIKFMQKSKYLNFADTYINTIFVDIKKWENR